LTASQDFAGFAAELAAAVASAEDCDVRCQIEQPNKSSGDALLKRLQCRRATWTIRIEPVLLDKFFNGAMGLRAQYYVNPYHGAFQNARLILLLRDTLLCHARELPVTELATVRKSLGASSAKVWIAERNLKGEKIIRASDLTLVEDEIQNDWLDVARAVKTGSVDSAHYHLYSAALSGVRTPVADRLEVKGGWMTSAPVREYVSPAKWDRDTQVFMFGFT
jgi:hypothetical protein